MSKLSEVKITAAKVVKFGLRLPPDLCLMAVEGSPVFPILDDDQMPMQWEIYLLRRGRTKERPTLKPTLGKPQGIIDLDADWKVAKIIIPDSEIHWSKKVVATLEEFAGRLSRLDPAMQN